MVFKILGASVTTKAAVGATAVLKDLTGVIPAAGAAQVLVSCLDANAVLKFGDSTVVASKAYTSDDLPAGNIVVLAGTVQSYNILPSVTHFSVISEDGATVGTVFVTPGGGEI